MTTDVDETTTDGDRVREAQFDSPPDTTTETAADVSADAAGSDGTSD